MDTERFEERCISYLYNEMNEEERLNFQHLIASDRESNLKFNSIRRAQAILAALPQVNPPGTVDTAGIRAEKGTRQLLHVQKAWLMLTLTQTLILILMLMQIQVQIQMQITARTGNREQPVALPLQHQPKPHHPVQKRHRKQKKATQAIQGIPGIPGSEYCRAAPGHVPSRPQQPYCSASSSSGQSAACRCAGQRRIRHEHVALR
jgi:hypothetical protein